MFLWPICIEQCTVEYSTVQYSSVLYSTLQYITVQFSTVQYITVQYGTVHYSTVQFSTVLYSTLQYGTVPNMLHIYPPMDKCWINEMCVCVCVCVCVYILFRTDLWRLSLPDDQTDWPTHVAGRNKSEHAEATVLCECMDVTVDD